MDADVLCRLLLFADNAGAGRFRIAEDVLAGAEVAAVVEFLVGQGWIVEDDDGWAITPVGRLWIRSVHHDYDAVKFYEYGGETFLVHPRINREEIVVWHSGRFVTVKPALLHFHCPGPYELRRDVELVTTSAGPGPEDALAAACRLLVDSLDVPGPGAEAEVRPPTRYQLREFLEGL